MGLFSKISSINHITAPTVRAGALYGSGTLPFITAGWNANDMHPEISLGADGTTLVRDGSGSSFVAVASRELTGKVYFEMTNVDADSIFGIGNENINTAVTGAFFNAGFWGYRRSGTVYTAGVGASGQPSGFDAHVYRMWFDVSAGKLWIAINEDAPIGGGDPFAGTTPTISGITGNTFRVVMDTREQVKPSKALFSAHTWQYGPAMNGAAVSSVYKGIDGSGAYNVPQALPQLDENHVYLFWFAGQSNMLGGDDQELAINGGGNLSTSDLANYATLQKWSSNSWIDLTISNGMGVQVPHGPEIGLVRNQRELLFHNRPVYTLKTAVGGTEISAFLSGGFYKSTFEDTFKAAVNNLVAAGKTVVPIFVWHQGESDYNNHASYATNLTTLIGNVRTIANAGGMGVMPVLLGELWDRPTYNGDFPNTTLLNAAINNVGANVASTYVLPTKDLPVYDLVHFTSGAQISFGELLVNRLRSQISGLGNLCEITTTI